MVTRGRLEEGMAYDTVVDLLRHGELEGGVRYRGKTEATLTPSGRCRMEAVWRELAGDIQALVSSPLTRCREPAEAWAASAGVPLLIEPRLREMEYGAWEGLTREEIETRFPGMLARWRLNPVGIQIPQAEDFEAFARRVLAGWRDMLRAGQKRHVLVVAHSGPLRVILTHVLDAPLSAVRRMDMPYGCWSRVRYVDGCAQLEFFNRYPGGR